MEEDLLSAITTLQDDAGAIALLLNNLVERRVADLEAQLAASHKRESDVELSLNQIDVKAQWYGPLTPPWEESHDER